MNSPITVLHQLDQKIIYPHYDFKHLTEKYFEIGMKLDDFLIQLVKYWKERDQARGIQATDSISRKDRFSSSLSAGVGLPVPLFYVPGFLPQLQVFSFFRLG